MSKKYTENSTIKNSAAHGLSTKNGEKIGMEKNWNANSWTETIEQIKSHAGIVYHISKYVVLRNRGKYHVGLCPFHREKTPSFTVNEQKKYFHCFGCGEHGDVITFLQKITHRAFIDVLKGLAKEHGISINIEKFEDDTAKAKKVLAQFVQAAEGGLKRYTPAYEYLLNRGLTEESIKLFRLGYVDDQAMQIAYETDREISQMLGLYSIINKRLLFPIIQDYTLVGYGARILELKTGVTVNSSVSGQNRDNNSHQSLAKYVNSPESILFSKRRLLYGAEQNKKYEKLIVCEGYLDVILVNQNTQHKGVAPLGTSLTEEQMLSVWQLNKEPVFCFDGDDAGRKATYRGVQIALKYLKPGSTVNVASLAQGDDPGSALTCDKKEYFLSIIERAQSLSDYCFAVCFKNANTPEQILKAKLQLKELLDQIDNLHVKNVFQEMWKQRVQEYMYEKRMSGRGNLYNINGKKGKVIKGNASLEKKKIFIPTMKNADDLQLRLLCAILLINSDIIEEVLDDFASLTMPSKYLQNIQSYILEAGKNENIYKPEKEIEYILRGTKNLIPSKMDAEKALSLWKEVYQRYVKEVYKSEISNLQKALTEEFSEQNWEKLQHWQKMLKEI